MGNPCFSGMEFPKVWFLTPPPSLQFLALPFSTPSPDFRNLHLADHGSWISQVLTSNILVHEIIMHQSMNSILTQRSLQKRSQRQEPLLQVAFHDLPQTTNHASTDMLFISKTVFASFSSLAHLTEDSVFFSQKSRMSPVLLRLMQSQG